MNRTVGAFLLIKNIVQDEYHYLVITIIFGIHIH